jgi:flagellar biosynthetic protein FliQ
MNSNDVIDLLKEAMWVAVRIGAPPMLVGLAIGLTVSVFQAMTQIQEATLTFMPKMVIVSVVIVLMMPFTLSMMTTFAHELADRIIGLALAH